MSFAAQSEMMMRLNLPVIATTSDYALHFNDDVWHQAAASICARHNLSCAHLRRSRQGENIIFISDERFVIKIYAPFRECYLREKEALEFAAGKFDIETPAVLHAGEIAGWSYLVMTHLPGRPAREVWPEMGIRERLEIVSQLGTALKKLHDCAAAFSQSALNRNWNLFIEQQARTCVERQRACGANPEWLESLPAYISEGLKLMPVVDKTVLLHGDVHGGNLLLVEDGGRWKISGLFDFGDSLCGFHEYDFVAPGVLMMQGSLEMQRAFLSAYGYAEAELDAKLRRRLMLLTVLYECSDLRKYAMRLAPEAVHLTLNELEAAIWPFVTQ